MNETQAGKFFIELGAVFNPKGFEEADRKTSETMQAVSKSFENLNTKTSQYSNNMTRFISNTVKLSSSSMQGFFDKSSKNFLNLESLTKNVFGNILQNYTSMIAQMLSNSVISGVTGLLGGGGGLLGGLLGSRETGGPIPQTGPYLLHAGEYVLPSDVVSSIKQGTAPASAARSAGVTGGGSVNLTVNTPVTVNGGGSNIDAKRLAEEVSAAARRGAAWAIEHAKISYKIGKQKSGEASL
ncbi:hypothetical protein AAIR98_001604 [Elusimicrobium simillimum]|uniref:hypothetical protein n=1 Tax=Elusimicrobium simillimum TaxID=3143438 RepID=UPI003C6F2903